MGFVESVTTVFHNIKVSETTINLQVRGDK